MTLNGQKRNVLISDIYKIVYPHGPIVHTSLSFLDSIIQHAPVYHLRSDEDLSHLPLLSLYGEGYPRYRPKIENSLPPLDQ